MDTGIIVSGLAATQKNFESLRVDVQRKIAREAMRAFSWNLAKPMRAATYANFIRRTGAVRSGLGVVVQAEPQNDQLKAYVVEYPQSIAGPATPFATLVRKRLQRKTRRSVSTTSVAFWWRFLEFGTKPRNQMRTTKKISANASAKRLARYQKSEARRLASPSRGGGPEKKWLRPSFEANAPEALKSFRDLYLKLVDAAVSAMPKK